MKRNIIFSTLIILLFSLFFIGGDMPYFLFYIFLFALSIPLFHCVIIYFNVSGSVQIPKGSIYVGDNIKFSYKVRNSSKLSIPYLEIENSISRELTGLDAPKILTALKPKDFFTYSEDVVLKRRGYYELGEIVTTISDVFGIYSIKKRISSETSLLVYPRPIDLNFFRITSIEQLGDMVIDDRAFQDKSRISSLRGFREGDSVKSIHWKITAKLGDLIVKEFEDSADTHVVVLVDNCIRTYSYDKDRKLEDKVADIGISIINYYINQNIPVSLQTQNENKVTVIEGQAKTDIKHFLEGFAKFKGNGYKDFDLFIRNRINSIRKGSTVIIITPNLDKTIGTLGIFLKTSNLKPIFIATTDDARIGKIDYMVERGLREDGIPVYVLDYDTNIKEGLEARA